MSVCMLPMAGRTAGPIKTKLGIGTHVDPGSVLVKVKVIYLCVRYNRIHDSDTWRTTMKHARSSSSRCHLVNAVGLFNVLSSCYVLNNSTTVTTQYDSTTLKRIWNFYALLNLSFHLSI